MKTRLFSLVILMVVSFGLKAQTWTNAFSLGSGANTNQNNAAGVCTDAAGNKYATGWFSGTVDFDPGAGTANLVTGNSTSLVICNTYLAKYDASGAFQYAVKIAHSDLINVPTTGGICTDGSYLYIYGMFSGTTTFGSTSYTASGTYDFFIAKVQPSDGSIVWVKQYGAANGEGGFGICSDHAGGLYINGYFSISTTIGSFTLNSTAYADAFTAKINASDGTVAWATKYGNSGGNSEGTYGAMVYNPSNNKVYALGTTNVSPPGESGYYGSFTVPLAP